MRSDNCRESIEGEDRGLFIIVCDEDLLLVEEEDDVACPVARARAFLADRFQEEVSIKESIDPEDGFES